MASVKGDCTETFYDEVLSLTPPFEMRLKKTGPIRLAGLLYEADTTALEKLVQKGMRIKVQLVSNKPDRYGRKAAHVYLKDGRWIQGELVRQGHATPFPYPGEHALIRDLYLLETPISQSALKDDIKIDQFGIIEGMVVDVAEIKGKTYLNFGSNWRDDFTIKIDKVSLKKFRAFGFDLPTLKGHRLRIRGWVFFQNGPMIAPQHPNQIEVIKE
ncbi:thermonuclease family protein [Candidatus Terasakiella magnetica]|nr:thermonuclease family protein [Candidatus Terasakiella magnetica]